MVGPQAGAGIKHFARRRGFTLIELLVVIGIIAALIGVRYPSAMSTNDFPGTVRRRVNGALGGCTVSFADGHAIFWMYSATNLSLDDFRNQFFQGTSPDVLQLAAWSGDAIPPGVMP